MLIVTQHHKTRTYQSDLTLPIMLSKRFAIVTIIQQEKHCTTQPVFLIDQMLWEFLCIPNHN